MKKNSNRYNIYKIKILPSHGNKMRILVKNQVVFVSAEEFHEIGLKIKSATSSCFAKQIENTNKTIVCVKFGWRSYFFFLLRSHRISWICEWAHLQLTKKKESFFYFKYLFNPLRSIKKDTLNCRRNVITS